jgi:hypothetical protein
LQRQKDKEFINKRDTVWSKIEELASTNPYYSKLPRSEEISFNSSYGGSGDDATDELLANEKFEAPPQEVSHFTSFDSFAFLILTCFSYIHFILSLR